MLNVHITGTERVNRKLRGLIKKLDNPRKALKLSGKAMMDDVKDHFKNEKGPDSRWKKSLRAKLQGGKTLRDTGEMFNSIMSSLKVGKDYAVIGTNKEYAPRHNFGKGKLPKRQFMWLSDEAGDKIIRIFMQEIDKQL